jgi:hypothetical protein
MSEFTIEDDPDPLSSNQERNNYPINLETGLAYEGTDVADSLLVEREMAEYERHQVAKLCVVANRLLSEHPDSEGEIDDKLIRNERVLLRRRSDAKLKHFMYFFVVNEEDGRKYCRSWSTTSEQVNWCVDEERHEPAEDVAVRLEEELAYAQESRRRQLAAKVLAKLRRSS